MEHIGSIFSGVILPIFFLLGIGALMQQKFQLDLYTLSKINIYYLSPAIVFSKLYTSNLPLSLFGGVLLFSASLAVIMYVISILVGKISRLNLRKQTAFTHSVLFYNSANFGIPVNELVFQKDPFAASIQVCVMIFQNFLVYSYGVFALNSLDKNKLKALLEYFKLPLFYALFLGLTLNIFQVELPEMIVKPIDYVANAMIALALLTLGCQIAAFKPNFRDIHMYISLLLRLLIAPALAFILLKFLNLEGVLAQALFISTAMPTAVNSSIIAQEYNNEPQYAAQTVVMSTLVSSLSVTIIIYLAMQVF